MGRVFDLRVVLQAGSTDCLSYAKLFTLLGRLFGLDTGIIETIKGGMYSIPPSWFGSVTIGYASLIYGMALKHQAY
ncbi:hypothetical protein ACFLVW_00905 [Chloroflexota bacterium]